MGFRFGLVFCCVFSFVGGADSRPDGIFCLGDRTFQGKSNNAFEFHAKRFTLPNAFWLAVAAYNSYSDEGPLLKEFSRWGFSNDADPKSHNQLKFISRDATATVELLGNKFTVPYADNQAVWAESKDGVILAFRGTTDTVTGDLVTNLRLFPLPTRLPGKVHLGFYGALRVMWKDLYRKLLDLRRRDLQEKRVILDRISNLEEAERREEAEKLGAWKIPVEGRLRFIQQWKQVAESNEPDEATRLEKQDELLRFLNAHWTSHQKPIWVTGHSLGGALAVLATQRMLSQDFNVAGLYTFGAPRSGDETFAHAFEVRAKELGIRDQIVRFVNGNDLIARVPPTSGILAQLELEDAWKHVGRLKYFSPHTLKEGAPELISHFREGIDIPKYVKDLEGDPGSWGEDHRMGQYVGKLEHIVFGGPAPCDP